MANHREMVIGPPIISVLPGHDEHSCCS